MKFMRVACWVWIVVSTTVILFWSPVSATRDHYLYGSHHITEDIEHIGPFGAPFYLSGPSVTRSSIDFSRLIVALLLGSYLTDAYNGDIRCRSEVLGHLVHDIRQGVHARTVMESYQTWLGEGPELAILRMLGLFDRPADEKALAALLKPPAIPGLTESLIDLSQIEWRTIVARLRRARQISGEDLHNPWQVDTHPLVCEYFGQQLRSQQTEAWKAFGNLQRRSQLAGVEGLAPLTYEHPILGGPGTFKGRSQGLRTLVTKSRLGCSHTSNCCCKVPRLHEDEELIFRIENLSLDIGFHQ